MLPSFGPAKEGKALRGLSGGNRTKRIYGITRVGKSEKFPFYIFRFLKAFFLKGSLFLIALKPRRLLLSLPPEKEGKESAKGGIMFPPFEPLTKAAAAGLLSQPGKYAGSK